MPEGGIYNPKSSNTLTQVAQATFQALIQVLT